MKSAEEWALDLSEFTVCMAVDSCACEDTCKERIAFVLAIQSDARESALREAAELCAPDRKGRDFVPGSFWERLEAEQRARILFLLPEASK
jgi:hypothetical protein